MTMLELSRIVGRRRLCGRGSPFALDETSAHTHGVRLVSPREPRPNGRQARGVAACAREADAL